MIQQEFLTRILDIGRQLAENRSLDPLLDYAMNAALELFNAERGYLILVNDDGSLDFRVKRERDGRAIDQPEREISQTILQKVIQSQEDLIVASALDDSDFQDAHSVLSLQIRSVLCVPMITRGRTVGALYLENRAGNNVFTKVILPQVRLFASQAAIAIENAQLNDELEARVTARTAELQHLVNELEAFASTVAHDLKIPLSVISGFAGILLDSDDRWSLKQQSYLQIIQSKINTMTETIDALLLLAQVHQLDEINVRPVDMGAVVEQVLTNLSPSVEELGAAIILPDAWPVVSGYAPWVREVWLNYLSNGLKYGGSPPRLELGADPPLDGFVRLWVRDNGNALQLAEPMQLFTPFTRLRKTEVEGHGLGLSIVQRIVTKLGGQVGVVSEPGKGNTFSFTLPAA
jgi:signal transduction histidine kinase